MSAYDQKSLEEKWQKQWQEKKIYHFDFDSKKSHTVLMSLLGMPQDHCMLVMPFIIPI